MPLDLVMANYQVDSWTDELKKYLPRHFNSISTNDLLVVDKQYGWTVFHALFSMQNIKVNEREAIFRVFQMRIRERGRDPRLLLRKTDNDGDTVFHSAVNHRVHRDVIEMMISRFPPRVTKTLLRVSNKTKVTPLKRAFDMDEWELVQVLLMKCIELRILPRLTGVRSGDSKTLLHRAFSRADHAAKYLKIHLSTCTRPRHRLSHFDLMQSLCVTDKNGQTPWFFLANVKADEKIEAVMEVLKQYPAININELFLDKTQSTLLHELYHQNRVRLAEVLERQCGANPEQINSYGLRPRQRRKVLIRNGDQQLMESVDMSNESEHPGHVDIWQVPIEESHPVQLQRLSIEEVNHDHKKQKLAL